MAEYVLEMRRHLQEMAELMQTNARKAQSRQKARYDQHIKVRSWDAGDQVLVLPQSSLKLQWTEPLKVLRRVSEVDYEVEVRRHSSKDYHINMLKKWHEPDNSGAFLAIASGNSFTSYPPARRGSKDRGRSRSDYSHELGDQ